MRSVVDAAVQYAQNIPVNVIGRMLGFPEKDEELFRTFVHDVLERINEEPGTRDGMDDLGDYIQQQIDEHRENPRDDLTTYLMNVELDGNKLEDDVVGGMIILLLIAGIDTTWSAIGSSLWHLAQHPEDHQRLLDDPEVMTFALEEFLRAYAPVTMARLVAKDNDFHGCPMKKDDWVLLPFPAANRDPLKFEDPDTFIVDRAGEPPRGVRARHPPLPRLEPRPPRAEGCHRGVHQALPALRARRRHPLERRPDPRSARTAGPHPRSRRLIHRDWGQTPIATIRRRWRRATLPSRWPPRCRARTRCPSASRGSVSPVRTTRTS